MSTAFHNELFYDRYFTTCFKYYDLPDKQAIAKAYQRLYGDLLPNDKNAAILDLGAGLGLLVAWLRDAGYSHVTGVEPSAEQCAAALDHYKTQLLTTKDIAGYLSEHNAYFDLVFLTDVIEHIPKSEMPGYLANIKRALKPGGFLVLRTDNMASPIGAYQYRMDFTHEYCFTERGLRQLLSTVGFEDITIRGEQYSIGRRPSSLKRAFVRWLWWKVLKELYEAERPASVNPRIFSKNLIAKCHRPKSDFS